VTTEHLTVQEVVGLKEVFKLTLQEKGYLETNF